MDILMYFILQIIIWKLLEVISNGEFTEEMGGAFIGIPIIIIYTLIYVIIFWYYDNNWIDIIKNLINIK